MDSETVVRVQDCLIPQNTLDIQEFIQFENWYQSCIQNLSAIIPLLTALIRKGVRFQWLEKYQKGTPDHGFRLLHQH